MPNEGVVPTLEEDRTALYEQVRARSGVKEQVFH